MKVVTTPSAAYHAVWDITGHADSDNKNSTVFMERAALTGVRASATTLMAVAALLAVAGAGEPTWGAVDLEAVINMDIDFSQFRTTYSDRIEYEYGEGSLLHQYLGGRQWVVEGTASEGRDVQNLEDMLNDKIASNGGNAKISVSDVGYEFRLEPASYGSAMERTIRITGNLTGYLESATVSDVQTDRAASVRESNAPADSLETRQEWVAYANGCDPVVPNTVVDTRWLSPTVTGDIVIDGVPINIPASLLREMEPEAYDLLAGTEADTILSRPLMDAGPIRQHADAWHSKVYPVGTSVDADTFGLSGGITDVIVSTWTIDVDDYGIGTEGVDEAAVTLDQTYVMRITHDTSSAMIRTIGYGFFDTIDGVEVVTHFQLWSPCGSNVISESPPWIMSAFIAFILVAIIVLMLIVTHRRDRRLQRSDDGRG